MRALEIGDTKPDLYVGSLIMQSDALVGVSVMSLFVVLGDWL